MKDDTPAFPTTDYYDEKPIGMTYGMTLRDYFAGKAMQALLMQMSISRALHARFDARHPSEQTTVAGLAYEIAGAMIAERGK